MINLIELIYHKKGFLSKEICDFLIDAYESNPKEAGVEHCPHAFTGVDTKSTFTLYSLKEGTEAFNLVHIATQKMVQLYQDYLTSFNAFHVDKKYSMTHPHLYRLMRYETGQKIHPHTDHDPGVYGSCTFNLNSDYTGGTFAFWGGKHKVQLEAGDAMIWPADYFWVHEVEPITSGVRYSTNCFIQNKPRHYSEDIRYFIT